MFPDNFNFHHWPENNRERRKVNAKEFDLTQDMRHFNEDIGPIGVLLNYAEEAESAGKKEEAENFWRCQILLLFSAFDFYMHEVSKTILCEMYDGHRMPTKGYNDLLTALEEDGKVIGFYDRQRFLDCLDNQDRIDTLTSYKNLVSRLELLGIDYALVAVRAFQKCDTAQKAKETFKDRLDSLNGRRALIAHQSDRDSRTAVKRKITEEDANSFIVDITAIVRAIDSVARERR